MTDCNKLFERALCIFLIFIPAHPYIPTQEAVNPVTGAIDVMHYDRSKPFLEQFRVKYVRGAEVIDVRDDRDNVFTGMGVSTPQRTCAFRGCCVLCLDFFYLFEFVISFVRFPLLAMDHLLHICYIFAYLLPMRTHNLWQLPKQFQECCKDRFILYVCEPKLSSSESSAKRPESQTMAQNPRQPRPM